jgi:hypothetical protein
MKSLIKVLVPVTLLSLGASMSWAQGNDSLSSSLNTSTLQSSRFERLQFDWKMGMSGTSLTDENRDVKLVNFGADFKFNYALSKNLLLNLEPGVRLQSGNTQSIEAADKPENRISVRQAALHYTPFWPVTMSAGALAQGETHSDLLVDSIAFPAARVALTFAKFDRHNLKLLVAEAIPTSSSLATQSQDLEKTPTFTSASLQYEYGNKNTAGFKLRGGAFQYSDLPGAVAFKSGLNGNTVEPVNNSRATFKYEYKGVEGSVEAILPLGVYMNLVGTADYVQNTAAPAESNQAYEGTLGADLFLSRNYTLQVSGGAFNVQEDATVAYFLSPTHTFGTNRVGYNANLFIKMNQDNYRIGAEYSEADVIFLNDSQSREKYIGLKLETFYANL